ncbi:MAG: hypothetical protein AAGC68_05320 [Verrucomicrobiota bacterium]
MKKAILVAVIGAMTLGVNAGDWGKAPIPAKAPIEECVDVGGEIASGYMSDYIFYGARFARESVWTGVDYTFENMVIPVSIGTWYLNGIDPSGYDELDIYASISTGTWAGFDTSLGYTHFFFPESGAGSYGEIGFDVSRSLGFVDFAAEVNYALIDSRGSSNQHGAWYYQAGIEKTFGITDAVSLVLGTGVGYSDNYFQIGGFLGSNNYVDSGWNHYYLSASLPIELNCRATITPYIGYSGAPGGWVMDGYNGLFKNNGPQSDILHGGVSLSVSF